MNEALGTTGEFPPPSANAESAANNAVAAPKLNVITTSQPHTLESLDPSSIARFQGYLQQQAVVEKTTGIKVAREQLISARVKTKIDIADRGLANRFPSERFPDLAKWMELGDDELVVFLNICATTVVGGRNASRTYEDFEGKLVDGLRFNLGANPVSGAISYAENLQEILDQYLEADFDAKNLGRITKLMITKMGFNEHNPFRQNYFAMLRARLSAKLIKTPWELVVEVVKVTDEIQSAFNMAMRYGFKVVLDKKQPGAGQDGNNHPPRNNQRGHHNENPNPPAEQPAVPCYKCGHAKHSPETCFFEKHPKHNPDASKSFLESAVGRAYHAEHGHTALTWKTVAQHERPPMTQRGSGGTGAGKRKFSGNNRFKPNKFGKSLLAMSVQEGTDSVTANETLYGTVNDFIFDKVLLDSGSIQVNIVNVDVAEELLGCQIKDIKTKEICRQCDAIHVNPEEPCKIRSQCCNKCVTNQNNAQFCQPTDSPAQVIEQICGVHTNSCQRILGKLYFNIKLQDPINDEQITIPIIARIIPCHLNMIIGRPTMRKWKLFNHFESHLNGINQISEAFDKYLQIGACSARGTQEAKLMALYAHAAHNLKISDKRDLIEYERDDDDVKINNDFLPWEYEDEQPATPSTHMNNRDTNENIPSNIKGNESFRREIANICKKYPALFCVEVKPEAAKISPFVINVNKTKWETPENQERPRPQTTLKQAEIFMQVEKMKRLGVIQLAKHYRQIHLQKKPNNKWRFCLDYRKLNEASEGQGYTIPNIGHILDRIGEKHPKFFAKLDFTSGYHQAPMEENSRKNSAFITPWGEIFEWTRCPMGPNLSSAPWYSRCCTI